MTTIVETIDRLVHKAAPPYHAGRKRPHVLALTVYDPGTAAQQFKRTTKLKISANAGALVPFMAPPPVDAVPLAAVGPSRSEPSWLRTKLFGKLKLRMDMEVQFIAEKSVTATDLDAQQSRFRLPNDGVQRHLQGMLSDDELGAAELLQEKAPRPRPPKQPPIQGQGELVGNRARKKGKNHVGLPVYVVDDSGPKKELKLTRWESSRSTVIHGDGYLDFIRQCSFKQNDVVEIWAFREKLLHLFGVDMCVPSPLYILIAKKEQQLAA